MEKKASIRALPAGFSSRGAPRGDGIQECHGLGLAGITATVMIAGLEINGGVWQLPFPGIRHRFQGGLFHGSESLKDFPQSGQAL